MARLNSVLPPMPLFSVSFHLIITSVTLHPAIGSAVCLSPWRTLCQNVGNVFLLRELIRSKGYSREYRRCKLHELQMLPHRTSRVLCIRKKCRFIIRLRDTLRVWYRSRVATKFVQIFRCRKGKSIDSNNILPVSFSIYLSFSNSTLPSCDFIDFPYREKIRDTYVGTSFDPLFTNELNLNKK